MDGNFGKFIDNCHYYQLICNKYSTIHGKYFVWKKLVNLANRMPFSNVIVPANRFLLQSVLVIHAVHLPIIYPPTTKIFPYTVSHGHNSYLGLLSFISWSLCALIYTQYHNTACVPVCDHSTNLYNTFTAVLYLFLQSIPSRVICTFKGNTMKK